MNKNTRTILSRLKRVRAINFFRRTYFASRHFNKRYGQILKWGIQSRETTNYTYFLTPDNLKYLVHTVAVVTKTDYDQLFKYVRELQNDEDLKNTILSAIEQSPEKSFADKEVRFGRRIGWYLFARVMKPKIIVETGVDKGLGSVLLCAALLRNKAEGFEGRYYGTDINPKAGYFLSGEYKKVGEILYGDSIKSLSQFSENIDLFINDSDHSKEYEYKEYVTIQPLLTDQSVILGDNAHYSSKLADFSYETGRNFLYFQEFPDNHWYPGAGIGISYKKSI